jgi:hypothetical protein
MMFRFPGHEDSAGEPMSADDAVNEFQDGMMAARSGGGGNASSAELDEERRKIIEEREKWEKEKSNMQTQRNEEEYRRAMSAVDNSILDLLPKTKEAKTTG